MADLPVGMFAFLIGLMVCVPEGMRVPTPFMSRPNSFAALCSHVHLVATLVRRSSYSMLAPVRGSMTLCMRSCWRRTDVSALACCWTMPSLSVLALLQLLSSSLSLLSLYLSSETKGMSAGVGVALGVCHCGDSGVSIVMDTLVTGAVGDVASSGGKEISSLVLKMVASCSRAVVCSGPNVGNGVAGLGLRNVWIRSVIACMALSLLESYGIGATCRKNLTVSETRMSFVEGI